MADADPSRPTPPDTRTLPLHDEIARQAHRLWESYGRPVGRDIAIWLEAERQILGVDAKVRPEAGGATAAEVVTDTLYPPAPPAPDIGSEPAGLPPGGVPH